MQCNGLKATPTLMEQFCKFGNAAASTRTLLWGDSYALSALPGVEAAFVAHGNGVYLSELAGCPPLLDVEVEPYHPAFGGILQKLLIAAGVHSKLACAEHNRQVLIWIAEDHIQNVILVGRWAHYVETVNDAKGGETQIELTDAQTPEGTPAANPAVFTRGLDRLLTVTKALHVKVFVMDSVPEFSQSIPHAMAAEQRLGTHWDLALPKAEYEMRQRQVSRILNNLQRGFDFMRLSPQDVLCSPSACEAERDGHPLYLDGEHLSPLGAIAIQPALEPIWQDAR